MSRGCFEQRAARARIVAIVLERIGHGFGHDRVRCEVHDGIDVVLAEQSLEQALVAGVADDQLARCDRCLEARRKVVERNHVLARGAQLAHDVAADIPGAARDEYLSVFHDVSSITAAGGPEM